MDIDDRVRDKVGCKLPLQNSILERVHFATHLAKYGYTLVCDLLRKDAHLHQ